MKLLDDECLVPKHSFAQAGIFAHSHSCYEKGGGQGQHVLPL